MQVVQALRTHILRRMHKSALPRPLQKWLKQSITVLPTKMMPVHRGITGARDMTVRSTIRSALLHARNLRPVQPIHHVRGSQKSFERKVTEPLHVPALQL